MQEVWDCWFSVGDSGDLDLCADYGLCNILVTMHTVDTLYIIR